MNISELKSTLNIATLQLNSSTNKEGKPDGWMRHWSNEDRVAISIHKETVAAIKANPEADLGLQTETRTADKGEYTAHRIVMYKAAEETL